MKKLFLTILTCLVVTSLYAGQLCDAIVTKGGSQIQCVISNVGDDEIQYRDCSNSNSEVNTISVTELRKIYLADGTIIDYTKGGTPIITKAAKAIENKESTAFQVSKEEFQEEPIQSAPLSEKFDVIITTDAQQMEAKIIEVSKTEIKYKERDNLDGPTFVLNTQDINSIIYSNGKVSVYKQPEPQKQEEESVSQTITISKSEKPDKDVEYDLARVEKFNGVWVFTDCTPIASYDVIGEVSVMGYDDIELRNSGGQYQSVRDGLIKVAKSANGQVEGVILTLITGGADKAHLIKFKDPSEDCSLARVKRYSGVYVFCDSSPLTPFEYLGSLKGKFTFIPQYTVLRDDFIKKVVKKQTEANGIILHLVTGGKDSAEAIKF